MPVLDLTDEELQGLIQLAATGSGPGITWVLTNQILTKAQQAASASHESKLAQGMQPHFDERSALAQPPPAYDAVTRPLEPPHRRRANSEDR